MYTATVLGNFVFIDGGEFSQLVDGYHDPGENSDANHTPYARQTKQSRISGAQ